MTRVAPQRLALLALSLAAGCGSSDRPSSSGPYVQSITSQTAIVAAVTAEPATLQVRYAREDEPLGEPLAEPAPVQAHGLELSGLTADTRYHYQLETTEGQPLGVGRFHTAPGSRAGACTFLALGDSGGTDEEYGEPIDFASDTLDQARGRDDDENQEGDVVAAMLPFPADFVLHTGDVVYPAGAREDYAEGFFQPFGPLIANVPLYPTLGNHDVKTEGGAPLLETFFTPRNGDAEGRYYSFDWGCVRVICLDTMSSPFDADSQQLRWLAAELAASADASWRVAFFHVPILSATRADTTADVEALVELLEDGGVDLVLNGHDHAYARFLPRRGTTYVVTGGGGKSLYPIQPRPEMDYAESVFHFVRVQAVPGELTLEGIDAEGHVFDAVTLRKAAPPG